MCPGRKTKKDPTKEMGREEALEQIGKKKEKEKRKIPRQNTFMAFSVVVRMRTVCLGIPDCIGCVFISPYAVLTY